MEKTVCLGVRGPISQTKPTSLGYFPFAEAGTGQGRAFRVKLEEVAYIESAARHRRWVFLSSEDIVTFLEPKGRGHRAHPFPPCTHVEAEAQRGGSDNLDHSADLGPTSSSLATAGHLLPERSLCDEQGGQGLDVTTGLLRRHSSGSVRDLVGDLGPHFLHRHNEGVRPALARGGTVTQNA